jgi:uncharacterized protein YjbI with pentapeptide repeats
MPTTHIASPGLSKTMPRATSLFGMGMADIGVLTTPLNADLSGGDMYMTSMDYTNFSGCLINSFNQGTFNNGTSCFITAHQSTFVGSDLSYSSIFWCDFSQADFTNADLSNTWGTAEVNNFTGANLTNANMSSSLVGKPGTDQASYSWPASHWDCCDFSGAIMRGADLRGTSFTYCMLIGANMTGALVNSNTHFTGCVWDATTTWPAGIDGHTATGNSPGAYLNMAGTIQTGVDFSGVCFSHGNFENTVFTDCILPGMCNNANFRGAQLLGGTTLLNGSGAFSGSGGIFCHSDFTGAVWDFSARSGYYSNAYNMAHCNFTGAHFKWSGAAAATATQGSVPITGFSTSTCAYANFTDITRDPDFQWGADECNFSFCNFTNAALTDALPTSTARAAGGGAYIFSESNYAFANMTGVKGGYYNGCDCAHTTWAGADLTYSFFTEANLSDADFSQALVCPLAAFVWAPTGSTFALLPYNIPFNARGSISAAYDSYTQFPPGFSPSTLQPCPTVATSTWDQSYYSHTNNYGFQDNASTGFGCYAYWQQTLPPLPPPAVPGSPSSAELDGYISDYSRLNLNGVQLIVYTAGSNATDLYVSSMSYVDWTNAIMNAWDGYCACLGSAAPFEAVSRGSSPGIPGPKATRLPAVLVAHTQPSRAKTQ